MTNVLDIWRDRTAAAGGRWSLSVIGESDLADHADLRHPAASIIKLPILVSVLDLIRDGEIAFEDRVAIRNEDVRGAGALRYLDLDDITVKQALTLMVTISDNVATNALIGHVGMDELGRMWAGRQCDGVELNRFLGHPPRSPEHDNYVTASAAARCLLDLDARAGEPTSRFGLGLLAQQQIRDRIPSRLPPEVECLNKTGELAGVRHDVALLRRAGRTIAVAMLSSGLPGVTSTAGGGAAAEAMGRTAAAIVGCSGQVS